MKSRKETGITLIALIVTIIVLLILAGVSIATLTGENGILNQADNAKIATSVGEEKEKVELAAQAALIKGNGEEITRTNLNPELTNNIGIEGEDYTLSAGENAPFIVKYLDSGRSYQIDANGKVSEYNYVDIAEYVKVGDYVDYNPTVADKSGTQVEASKLTYTSPTGSGTEHGNGVWDQKYIATTETKWKVLSVEDGKVELISENPIKTDVDSGFIMYGPIGYLYAEQELNEICKIYGYGYGADTSQVTKYSYGGPLDGNLTGKIIGSGARSITIEDINKKAKITEDDYTTLNNNYGSTANPTGNVYYPTIATGDGKSASAGAKNLNYTAYTYSKTKIEDPNVQNMLFNSEYWISSRSIGTFPDTGYFLVYNAEVIVINSGILCNGNSSNLTKISISNYAVRPIVSLKSNVIDINTDYETEGHWNLK